MPGYLTHTAVLIDTVKWLRELERRLPPPNSSTPSQPQSPHNPETTEDRIRRLARRAREYLGDDPSVDPMVTPASVPTVIKNGVGQGISQFAFVGAIGLDFPAAGNVLALNHTWVSDTMHKGSPRRALFQAGSTQFVLSLIDEVKKQYPAMDQRRPFMAYALGHLSAVATEVILGPFINSWLWTPGQQPRNRLTFEVELDAKLAMDYFQRHDLHDPAGSWTDYFLDAGDHRDDMEHLLDAYLTAFNKTYDGPDPLEALCGIPSVTELKGRHSELQAILDAYKGHTPSLEAALTRYPGYDELLKRFDGLQARLDGATNLRDELAKYEGKYASLNRDFLLDAYKNTRNWAIDAGYDHGPTVQRILISLGILGTSAFVTWKIMRDLKDDSVNDTWKNHGLWNEKVIFILFNEPYTWTQILLNGNPVFALGMILTGHPILTRVTDGIFGQGTDGPWQPPFFQTFPVPSESGRKISFWIYSLATFGLSMIGQWTHVKWGLLDELDKWGWRWGLFLLGALFDSFEQIAKAIGITARSRERLDRGIEEDVLNDRLLWEQQILLTLFCVVSSFIAFGRKAAHADTEPNLNFWDILLGWTVPGIFFIPWQVWRRGAYDDAALTRLIGTSWPSVDTSTVAPYLQQPSITGGAGFQVQLFPLDPISDPNGHYPQDDTAAWPEHWLRDDTARKTASQESQKKDYKLQDLFNRATYLSGMLAMGAVDYHDMVTEEDRNRARTIFRDWNLDYRMEYEWEYLMGTGAGNTGLLEVVEAWWSDVQAGRPSSATQLQWLESAFDATVPIPGPHGDGAANQIALTLQYEDGTPMAHAELDAVFGEQHVAARTDRNGTANILPPAGLRDSFRLFLRSYPQEQVVEELPA